MSTTLLRDAIRRGLNVQGVAGAALAFAAVAPAMAQDAPGSQQLETVTVTGSRIRKADVETAQPILVLDRAAIEKQGFNSVADILSNLTEAGSPAISRSSVLASGENVGGYYIDLRNLGANRTLILLNGKRLGATSGGLQDLSQIPISAIERMEVLKDGASAIYGSDAIAGVVNIITRRNYDGMEASAYVGQYDDGDGTKQTYSMTLGSHNERSSITVAAEYSKEDPTWARNRPYSAYPSGPRHSRDDWTPVSQWGAFTLPGGCPGIENSPFATCTLNPGGNPFNNGRDGRPNDFHGTNSAGGTTDLSNSNQSMMGTTGIERHSLFVAGEYSITDNIKFSSDILYNKRSTTQQVAGYPYQSKNGSFEDQYLSADSYYNPFGNKYMPEGEGQDIYFMRRFWEVPRVTRSDLQTYRFSGTLEGTFELMGRTWNWDVGGFVNTNDLLKTGHGDGSLPALKNALGASYYNPLTKRVECGSATAPIQYGSGPGQCVPWNPFYGAGVVGPDSLTGNPELQKYLFPFYHDTGRTKTVDYSANLTGSLFSLPAGDLSIATGYEHRQESGRFEPDASKQGGQSTDLAGTTTKGRYSVDEYYLEVDVPVLKDVMLAKELSFNVAGRFSDYSTFGNTTNGKFSLTWRPIEDLLVRANYAQGFRAPTIDDLYGGSSQSFDKYSDPCDEVRGSAAFNPDVKGRCRAGFGGHTPTKPDFRQIGQGNRPCAALPCQTGVAFMAGSNPNLTPETSTSKTAGLVYSPQWIQGLDVSLDWYNVRIKNVIAGDTITQMLEDCYVFGVASRCGLFTRDANGVVNTALRAGINQGWNETEGYDLGINYRLPEFSFGRFRVSWDSTYTSLNNVKPDNKPTTPVSTQNSYGGFPRLRSNLSLDWSLGDFGATWTARYYSGMKEKCSYDLKGGPECNMPDYVAPDVGKQPQNRTGATTWHDLQVRWSAPWNATISVGANNVFNKQPPLMYEAPNSQFLYYGGFDIGRFYYLRYTQKF